MIAEQRLNKEIYNFSVAINKSQLAKHGEVKSESQTIHGVNWRLECDLDFERDEIFVSLHALEQFVGLFAIDYKYKLTLTREEKRVIELKSTELETMSYDNKSITSIPKASKYFVDTVSGEVLILELAVRVYRTKVIDMSKPSKFCDIGLKTQNGVVIYVSKTLLSINSPVFERLFASTCFKDNEENIYDLGKVDFGAMLVVLYQIYGMEVNLKDLPKNTFQNAIDTAYNFRVDSSLRTFEKYLLNLPSVEMLEYFAIADRFGLIHLVHKIIAASGKDELRHIYNEYGMFLSYDAYEELTARLIEILQ